MDPNSIQLGSIDKAEEAKRGRKREREEIQEARRRRERERVEEEESKKKRAKLFMV